MSHKFYHLRADPFRSTPDPAASFPYEHYVHALTVMQNALQQKQAFVTVTGSSGIGKTMLIEEFQSGLDSEKFCIARINCSPSQTEDFLRPICWSLALDVDTDDKTNMIHLLWQFLIQQARTGRRTLLLIDEAQHLSQQALEELYLLGNLQLNSEPVLHVFMIGQQSLLKTLQCAEMKPLFQSLGGLAYLAPLSLQETREYIEYRLYQAGWSGDAIFTDRTYRMIHRFSTGLPQQINKLCARLLRYGSDEKKDTLDSFDTLKVMRGLLKEWSGANYGQLFGKCLDILNESWPASANKENTSNIDDGAQANKIAPEFPGQESIRTERLTVSRKSSLITSYADNARSALAWSAEVLRGGSVRIYSVVSAKGGSWQAFKSLFTTPDLPPLLSSISGAVVITVLVSLLFVWGNEEERPESGVQGSLAISQVKEVKTVPVQFSAGFVQTVTHDADRFQKLVVLVEDELSEPETSLAEQNTELLVAEVDIAPLVTEDDLLAQVDLVQDDELQSDKSPIDSIDPLLESEGNPSEPKIKPATSNEHESVQILTEPSLDRVDPVDQINEWIAQAEQAINDDRLTVPAKNNAFFYYNQVIQISPDHRSAKAGIQRIADHYARLIKPMLKEKRARKAKAYVGRGLKIAPDHVELLALKERVIELDASLKAQANMAAIEVKKIKKVKPVNAKPAQKNSWEKLKIFFQNPVPPETP